MPSAASKAQEPWCGSQAAQDCSLVLRATSFSVRPPQRSCSPRLASRSAPHRQRQPLLCLSLVEHLLPEAVSPLLVSWGRRADAALRSSVARRRAAARSGLGDTSWHLASCKPSSRPPNRILCVRVRRPPGKGPRKRTGERQRLEYRSPHRVGSAKPSLGQAREAVGQKGRQRRCARAVRRVIRALLSPVA